jgi:hypothetical protein
MSHPIYPAGPMPPGTAGFVADRLYRPDEAALMLGIMSARQSKSLGTISRRELPMLWVGPNGGVRQHLGRDTLAVFSRVCNLSRPRRQLLPAPQYRATIQTRFQLWYEASRLAPDRRSLSAPGEGPL